MSAAVTQPQPRLRVAVNQSNYLPWKGYFDLMHDVDVFVFYDDVKYTKNDWRNRNVVKMNGLPVWLTIPIGKAAVKQRICDVQMLSSHWQIKHWRSLKQCYSQCAYFEQYASYFEDIYCHHRWTDLSALNQLLIRQIAAWLDVKVVFADSRNFSVTSAGQERLLTLLEQVGATSYLSGPAARAYIDPADFARRHIDLHFKTYQYPEYPQGKGPFWHNVSIVDLLFRFGPHCAKYIWDHDLPAVSSKETYGCP